MHAHTCMCTLTHTRTPPTHTHSRHIWTTASNNGSTVWLEHVIGRWLIPAVFWSSKRHTETSAFWSEGWKAVWGSMIVSNCFSFLAVSSYFSSTFFFYSVYWGDAHMTCACRHLRKPAEVAFLLPPCESWGLDSSVMFDGKHLQLLCYLASP